MYYILHFIPSQLSSLLLNFFSLLSNFLPELHVKLFLTSAKSPSSRFDHILSGQIVTKNHSLQEIWMLEVGCQGCSMYLESILGLQRLWLTVVWAVATSTCNRWTRFWPSNMSRYTEVFRGTLRIIWPLNHCSLCPPGPPLPSTFQSACLDQLFLWDRTGHPLHCCYSFQKLLTS